MHVYCAVHRQAHHWVKIFQRSKTYVLWPTRPKKQMVNLWSFEIEQNTWHLSNLMFKFYFNERSQDLLVWWPMLPPQQLLLLTLDYLQHGDTVKPVLLNPCMIRPHVIAATFYIHRPWGNRKGIVWTTWFSNMFLVQSKFSHSEKKKLISICDY